jgi:hypothetical protein
MMEMNAAILKLVLLRRSFGLCSFFDPSLKMVGLRIGPAL